MSAFGECKSETKTREALVTEVVYMHDQYKMLKSGALMGLSRVWTDC